MSLFHRYKSTIHGNYRKASLMYGPLVALLMAAYVVVRHLVGRPLASPFSLLVDIAYMASVALLMAYYRKSLPDGKMTLKEGTLVGMGMAVVAGIVYGLLIWAICAISTRQTLLFTNTITQYAIAADNPQLNYWAAWWGLLSGVQTMLLGAFAAFLAAIFLKNESPKTI